MADDDQDVALEEEEQQDQPAQESRVEEPAEEPVEEPSIPAQPSRKQVPVYRLDDFGKPSVPAQSPPPSEPAHPEQPREQQGPTVYTLDDFSEGRVGFQEQQPKVNAETGEIELPPQQVAAPPPTAPVTKRARPATQLENGLYQDEDPHEFVSGIATVFATPEDLARYQDAKAHGLSDAEAFAFSDNGIGNRKLGGLRTPELVGVAIPEEVLRARYGNNPAFWRTLRIDVVDSSTGQRLRLPIVDTGPSAGQQAKGIAADFTPFVDNYFGNQGGGKKYLFKIVENAGPDVLKNPQDFADEQAALKQGVDVSAISKAQQPQKQYRAISPAEQVAAEQAVTFGVQSQTDNLKQFQEEHPNPADQLRLLEKPVEGISDGYRRAALQNLREAYTKEAQDYYKEPDPKKALERLMSPAGPGDIAAEYFRQAQARYTRLDASIYATLSRGDENYVSQFVKDLEPNATGQARAEFINNLLKIPPGHQGAMLQAYIEHLPEGQRNKYDLATLVNGLQNIGSPEEQAKREAILKSRLAQATQDMQGDPRLKGTAAEFLAGQAADITINTMAAFLPPGFRETVFFAQLKQDSLDQLARDHPDWSKDQLDELSTKVAAAQLLPQEALSAVTHGTFNRFLQGIPNRWARAGAMALTNTAIGAGAGGVQQATANVMTGKPVMENVPQAATAGAIQGAVPGVVHGVGEVVRPRVREEAPAPVVTPEPEQAPPAPPPVTAQSVLGPETPAETIPWYKPGPIVTRAEERTAFSPQELARKVEELRVAGWSPSQIQQAIENLRPEPDWTRRGVYLAEQPITREDVARRTYELYDERIRNGQPGTALDDYVQAQRELVTAKKPPPPTQGESEPWVSAIANRHTAERAARGQLGDVIPGEGYTKEELRAVGLQMTPEQINQHVSDLMHNTGDPKLQAAAVTAEEARLSQRSHAASRASEADLANKELRAQADNAFKDLTDFHNGPVAKLKNNWHAQGMTLQGEVPMDLTTFNGLREKFLRDVGKAPPLNMEPVLRKTAKRVSDSVDANNQALHNLGLEIESQTARRRLPTADEVRTRIMERMRVDPCPT
jgi:hypothetical protein